MDAFAMGDYGAYVWSSFALTIIVVVIAAVQGRIRHWRLVRDIRTHLAAMESSK